MGNFSFNARRNWKWVPRIKLATKMRAQGYTEQQIVNYISGYGADVAALANENLQEGMIIKESNFVQKVAHTSIFTGITVPLTFEKCNLTNCDLPPQTVHDRRIILQKEFCYWLHSSWDLPVEPENCPHVIDTDIIRIDGADLHTEYYREDVIVP